jgi:20S proteasome alpha/beta subunit
MGESRHIELKQLSKKLYKRMTCIIGGVCDNGIILAADRRVLYADGSIESREKIFKDFHPFVVASSGYTGSFDNFRKEAKELANKSRGYYDERQHQFTTTPYDPSVTSGVAVTYHTSIASPHYPVIPFHSYLDGLKRIIQKYKREAAGNPSYFFDVLVVARTQDNMHAYLGYIDDKGMMTDIGNDKRYIAIGSDKITAFALSILKPLWKNDLKMKEFAELAYFIIKYVDRFKTDYTVGLEAENPSVWFIPHIGEPDKASDEFMQQCENNVNTMLDNFESHGIRKLL